MQSFQFVALTPPGLGDPAIAIAASRAGALGVLDLEFTRDAAHARRAIERLAHFARGEVGVRLDSADAPLAQRVLAELPAAVGTVILTAAGADALPEQIAAARTPGRRVWLEVTSLEQARQGGEWQVDGLLAKGNESGGWIGEETAFILLQRLLSETELPIWVRGGIGLHTAAACAAAGAAGVVLDSQLALTRESTLPEPVRTAITGMDGSETLCLGAELGRPLRVYTRPRSHIVEETARLALSFAGEVEQRDVAAEWRDAVRERTGWGEAGAQLWPIGQDAAFAAPLAERYRTVGGILAAMREAVDAHLEAARRLRPLDADSPLAASHGTRYPIVQGPMTRVSDVAPFALSVAEGGALPFLALALMRAPEVEELLRETQLRLGDKPWGVGILGFVPLDLRQEQLEIVRRYRPPFALIAGGRPDQAHALEQEGIATYLHVPSPGLLRLFLQDGARRFVFEGRECGGHVGPRSSFVLWNSMVDVLLEQLPASGAEECHVLFAGGVHDALSAAMVAALAAPLAERGVKVGVLVGTAYLFTQEAVEAGAILPGFQQKAFECEQTVLVESGPGHAVRCVGNPFTAEFERVKRQLQREGRSAEEIRLALEELNIGRLRVASKGVERNPRYGQTPGESKLVAVDEEAQRREGMYMIGQVAALRRDLCSIAELHQEIAVGATRRLDPAIAVGSASSEAPDPSRIAIIGISCILPGAKELPEFWDNVLDKVYAITEVPPERWDPELYFDPDRSARDKIYSRWGGFIDDVPFDPLEFGMPPTSLRSIDPMQLLALKAAHTALGDAGYRERPFDRSRTSVVLGASGGTGDLGALYCVRAGLPLLLGQDAAAVIDRTEGVLPEWTEDSFAGLLPNVAAGRIANRLDLGGVNFAVDAACASSLAAVHLAVRELETHASDVVIAGGVDTVQNPFGYLCFSKTQALSPTGQPRTFDATADGIAISEGVVMLVLKRLEDAERDGDRIYAVIQGSAGSSDGKAKGLTAPRPEGQQLALQRAYAKAGISPTTVGLFEAHGTGTVVGDRTEAVSLSAFLEENGAQPGAHAVGSVKSMIGHTKATAGVAGVAKIALALHHRVLPPTLGVTTPNPNARFGEGPLYINSEARPWIHSAPEHPRRAGVSAFGFGGTNFHAVLEEYTGDYLPRQAISAHWPSELLLWTAPSRPELLTQIESLDRSLAEGARPELPDLAYTLAAQYEAARPSGASQLAIVATSLDDLREKLALARGALQGSEPAANPRGIYYADASAPAGEVAFLFPGQGSQYPNMLRDLTLHVEEVRETFESADSVLEERFARALSAFVFPPPAFTPEEERAQQQAITRTDVAQPALGAADAAMLKLLDRLGVRPAMVAGHSYGEYVALHAAGVFDERTLLELSEARGRSILEAAEQDLGTMAAVSAAAGRVGELLSGLEEVWIANLNAPEQTIISGTRQGVERATERLQAAGLQVRSMAVACAFHSPLVAPAQARLAERLAAAEFASPRLRVFSNTTAAPYPPEPEQVAALLAEHLVQPVRFAEQIQAMYQAGARIFVEVGPKGVLTGLTRQILGDRPHLAIATDQPGRNGITQLQHTLAQLAAGGVTLRTEQLYQGRPVRRLNLLTLLEETRERPLSATTWLVNGGSARPASQPRTPVRRATLGMLQPPAPATNGDPASVAPSVAPASPVANAGSIIAPGTSAASRTMLQHQQLMQQFLETQRQVMTSYLRGAPAAAAPQPLIPARSEVLSPEPSRAAAVEPVVASVATEVAHPAVIPPAPIGPAGRPTPEEVMQRLLEVVSERTGYPADMLTPDADLEAELGIDSIKRVEIIGVLRQQYLDDAALNPAALEQLTAVRTLRALVAQLEELLQAHVGAPPVEAPEPAAALAIGPAAAPGEARPTPHADSLPRLVLDVVEAPLTEIGAFVPDPGRLLLLTDDGGELATALAARLEATGGQVVRIRPGAELRELRPGLWEVELARPAEVEALVAQIRVRYGPIGGILHLLPANGEPGSLPADLHAWRLRLQHEVKGLFYLAKAAAADLRGGGGRSVVLAATALGGSWGLPHAGMAPAAELFPGRGAIAGFLRTLALEWPEVRCRAVDLDASEPAEHRAEVLLHELAASGEVQVGYAGGRRWAVRALPRPVEPKSGDGRIAAGDVLLLTGGARGITAEVAVSLAERYRPVLILTGRSPLPAPAESPETAALTSEAEIKAALIAGMRQRGEEITLARVGAACARVLQEREIRRNLERMRRAGATVRYEAVDACDEQAMRSLVARIEQEWGRLDGVIHGAGIIEDKRIEEKQPGSFDRVFDTKADSAFILSRVLRPEWLKFLVFFSSASGAYGNVGQADYAAANALLNTLAADLDRRWPGRVVALGWGPWRSGMVTPELERQFNARGVQLIDVATGCEALDRELRLGSKGEAAVVLAGGSWGAQPAVAVPVERIARPTAGAYPLLAHATEVRRNGGTIEAIRTLDLAFDRYLDDHRLDNKPVLPLTAAMELMAELAQLGWPDLQVSGMRDIQLLKGVILESSTRTIRVAARALADPPSDRTGADVHVEITGADDASRVHYRATVELSSQIPAPESYSGDLEQRIAPFPLNVAEAYARWLFHGPAFQCVDRIEGFADEGIVTLLRPSRAAACLGAAVQGEWLLDPVLLDGALQSLLLWARGRHGLTALPTRIRRYRRFPRQGSGPVRTYVLARLLPDQHTIHATLLLIDEDQRVRHIIEGGEFVGSTALNRLAGQAAPAAASAAAVNAASVVSLAPISEEA